MAPDPTGGGAEPSWWPEFEREFRAYAGRGRSTTGRSGPAEHVPGRRQARDRGGPGSDGGAT